MVGVTSRMVRRDGTIKNLSPQATGKRMIADPVADQTDAAGAASPDASQEAGATAPHAPASDIPNRMLCDGVCRTPKRCQEEGKDRCLHAPHAPASDPNSVRRSGVGMDSSPPPETGRCAPSAGHGGEQVPASNSVLGPS